MGRRKQELDSSCKFDRYRKWNTRYVSGCWFARSGGYVVLVYDVAEEQETMDACRSDETKKRAKQSQEVAVSSFMSAFGERAVS